MPIRNPRINPQIRASFPQPPSATRLYRNIAITFLGLTIIVVGVAVWMSSTKAQVRIHVKRDVNNIETIVEVAKDPEPGQLQGRVVEGTFDNIQEFTVTEKEAEVVVATTTGNVRITNNYSKDQPLIKTTRLLTSDGKLFRINKSVTVPSGGSIEVEAYSDKPGKNYLIPTGTIFTIPGLWIDLQSLIKAEAISGFTGQSGKSKIVTAAELVEAQKTLEEAVLEQAKKTLAAEASIPWEKLGQNCAPNDSCWEGVYLVKTLEKKSNVSPGQQTAGFLAQVKMEVKAVFYPKKDIQVLVQSKLKERLPEGRDLVDYDSGRVVYRLEQADTHIEEARLTIMAEAYSRLTENSPALSKDAIAGLSIEDAKTKLAAVDGTEFVEITLRPSWARKIPRQKDKIEMIIE
ncbi:MAG: hypothetical protein ABII13_02210 [Patescibacteria group bacterium]|nr:hypothetical protein [Patescibacteria group bacterium]MBU2509067.1 hypothetical protein [Patescibacteria group bacterium]